MHIPVVCKFGNQPGTGSHVIHDHVMYNNDVRVDHHQTVALAQGVNRLVYLVLSTPGRCSDQSQPFKVSSCACVFTLGANDSFKRV